VDELTMEEKKHADNCTICQDTEHDNKIKKLKYTIMDSPLTN
jgi:hypothetical protein